MVFRVSG